MPNPLSNRKNVRGWPRQVQRVQAWQHHFSELDIRPHIAESEYVLAKIWIDPWYRLTRRTPPAWLRKRMVEGLLSIHDAWETQARRLGQPVLLQVWVCSPRFMESCVVAAVGTRAEYYARLLPRAAARSCMPEELRTTAFVGAKNLVWTSHTDDELYDDDDFADSPALHAMVRLKAWRTFNSPWFGRCLALRRGDTWVGCRRSV